MEHLSYLSYYLQSVPVHCCCQYMQVQTNIWRLSHSSHPPMVSSRWIKIFYTPESPWISAINLVFLFFILVLSPLKNSDCLMDKSQQFLIFCRLFILYGVRLHKHLSIIDFLICFYIITLPLLRNVYSMRTLFHVLL